MSENLQQNSAADNATESEDVALAKILQQQEHAFLELRGAPLVDEGPPPGLTEDEELAWRLMREEEAMFQHRMMVMAGMEAARPSDSLGVAMYSAEDAQFVQRDGRHDDAAGIQNEQIDDVDDVDQNGRPRHRGDGREVLFDMDPDNLTYEELTTLGDLAGTVACGLTEEQVARLVHATFGELGEGGQGGNRNDRDPCIVCQLDFEAEDPVIKLPCSHVFHEECLRPWLSRKKNCPYCSKDVSG